jgi:hypothetical protein
MSKDPPLVPETLAALSDAFAVPVPASADLEAVRRFLAGKVAELLDRNPAMLMSILYRVDVAERDVKRALAEESPESMPRCLADLLIERQLQKLRLRRQYRADDDGPAEW